MPKDRLSQGEGIGPIRANLKKLLAFFLPSLADRVGGGRFAPADSPSQLSPAFDHPISNRPCHSRKAPGVIGLGDPRSSGNPSTFRKLLFIHQFKPPKERVLDALEEKLFPFADGRLSIAEIICKVCAGEEGAAKEGKKEKVIDFFWNIFANHWGLAFGRSWRN
jgi:hypothetical protein